MRCVSDPAVRIEAFAAPDTLPPAARALFGGDAFATLAWYGSVTGAAVPADAQPCFQLVRRGAAVLGVFPMWHAPAGFCAMTTPYTVLWRPLLRSDLSAADLQAAGQALGRVWRRGSLTKLDALDGKAAWLPPLLRGLARAGLVPLRFGHFGNWHMSVTGLG